MKTLGKIMTALSLAFTAAGMPAEAMPTYQFLNKEKYTDNGTLGALQISLRMEALRSADAGQDDRAACIIDNFVTRVGFKHPGFDALLDDITAPGHLEKPIEAAIVDNVNSICGKSDLPHAKTSPADALTAKGNALTAKDFFELYTIPLDKQLILVTTVSTQIARLTQSGNQNYAQCLQTNFSIDEHAKTASVGLSAIVRKLVANKAASSDEPVERTILNVIADKCGSENLPVKKN